MVFGAIANVVGGLLGARSAENAKDANVANAAMDREMQREFAQHGIRWRVADAKAAGIHPLFAMGAQPASFSPSSIPIHGDNSLGAGIAAAGQDISRAVNATAGPFERLQMRLLESQIQGQEIENAIKASSIATKSGAAVGPPMPSGVDAGIFSTSTSELTSPRLDDRSMEAAPPAPASKEFMMRDGTVIRWPSKDSKESIEDSPYEYEHMWHERIKPWMRDKLSRAKEKFWEIYYYKSPRSSRFRY